MPKLHIFAVCEKVIMDEHKNPSLIVLIENINVGSREEKIPRNAVTPKEWAIFTQWIFQEEEQDKPFVHIVQVFWPDKTEFNKITSPIPIERAAVKQMNLRIVGMPVGQEGTVTVKLWLELESQPASEVFIKNLYVKHPQEPKKVSENKSEQAI